MTAIFAQRAYLGQGWAQNVRLTLSDQSIETIEKDAVQSPNDIVVKTLLPALANLHSHSFQRAMAGMTEFRAAGRDSFWTWRDLMYRFLDRLTPDQIEDIAALVFMEMQEAGYASVGEFHYVHHQPGGTLHMMILQSFRSAFLQQQTKQVLASPICRFSILTVALGKNRFLVASYGLAMMWNASIVS